MICKEIKIIKLLQRFSRILQNDSHLTKIARKKLARVVREYFPLNIIRKNIQERAIQIHLTESLSRLPFVEAIFKDNTLLSSQLETYPVTQVLCDTGSDFSLIPYKLFKSMDFTSRNLMPKPVYNIKGSTGMSKNVVLGSYKLDIYIKNKMGQFGSITHKFLICNPSLQLDHILLGLDILEAMQAEIKCEDLQILAKLLNNDNYNRKMPMHISQILM